MDHAVKPRQYLAELYSACLSFAEACVERRRLLLVTAVPATVLVLAAIGQFVLQEFPNSGDEYAYLYQAATMARGRLTNPAPAPAEAFELFYITQNGGRAYSSFPPGWPLLLAAAMRLHVPVWLVNPLLGALTLVLIFLLGRELHGARTGMLAAWLTGISPFFLFNGASYFSHTFCGALLLGAAWMASRAGRAHPALVLLAGFLVGWAVVTRYFTGVVCALPIAALLVRDRRQVLSRLAFFALGGLPWLAFLLAYNDAMTGSPWRLTTLAMTADNWFAPGFVLRGGDIMSTFLLRFMLWTPPALLAAYLFYLRRAPRELRRGLLDWMPVLVALSFYFYVNRGGNQYGPRFYYEAFPYLVIFTVAALFREERFDLKDLPGRRLFAAMAVSAVAIPLMLAIHVGIERLVIVERKDLFRAVAAANLTHAIVLLSGRVGTRRSMAALDLTRNGIDYNGPVLYALDRGRVENCRLRARFGRRTIYQYTWNAAARRGALAPVRCQ
jgi:hypothetical protein